MKKTILFVGLVIGIIAPTFAQMSEATAKLYRTEFMRVIDEMEVKEAEAVDAIKLFEESGNFAKASEVKKILRDLRKSIKSTEWNLKYMNVYAGEEEYIESEWSERKESLNRKAIAYESLKKWDLAKDSRKMVIHINKLILYKERAN